MTQNINRTRRSLLAGGTMAALAAATGAAHAKEGAPAFDKIYDVIVVGSGFAGLAAALQARLKGAEVLLIEKMPVFGGNSAITGFWINVPRTPEQLAHGVKDDSPELFLKDTLKAGEYFNDPKLAHALCFKALESFEYIRKLGCEFALVINKERVI